MTVEAKLSLTVRRTIPAARERVFAAWVESRHVRRWWGPQGVACTDAAIDLRVGGSYRIVNRLPDGSIVTITGIYEEVSPPSRLIFYWRLANGADHAERVTVDFLERDAGRATEVVVTHEKIRDARSLASHDAGWIGCLHGLEDYLARPTR